MTDLSVSPVSVRQASGFLRVANAGRVAVLVKRFPRLSETFVLAEFLELRRHGVDVHLFSISDPREPWAQPEAEALRPEVTYLRDRPGRLRAMARAVSRHPRGTVSALRFGIVRRSRATWRHLGEALALVDDLDRLSLTHVHAHFAHGPAAVAYLAHLVSGVGFSFTAHAKDLYTTPRTYVAARSDAASFVATCTQANVDYLVGEIGVDPAKVVLTRHGTDLERFATIVRRPSGRRILAVGRLVPKKGFDLLVRACAALDRSGVDFECVIVGDGPERERLEALVAELGLAHRITLAPARPQSELVQQYAVADVFVLPCRITDDGDRDGVPNVVMEAMATGIPVVATAVSGLPEVVLDGVTGTLVPPEDPAALARALAAAIDDARTAADMGSAGRRRAIEEFSWERCIPSLIGALASSAGEAPGGGSPKS